MSAQFLLRSTRTSARWQVNNQNSASTNKYPLTQTKSMVNS